MNIAVISDIHDNLWSLQDALKGIQGCDVLLCLGDLCSPFTISTIAEGFGGAIHVVWGNNDGDRLLIVRNADKAGNVTLHGDLAELQIGGRSIAMTHYPRIGKPLAASGQYDLVCYGHNHNRDMTWMGTTLLLNPGEVMGRFGVHSYAIYDTERGEAKIYEF
jgi:putative phosphoesterase